MNELDAVRKIRACEGDAAAQVVLANYASIAHSTGFRAGIEAAKKVVMELTVKRSYETVNIDDDDKVFYEIQDATIKAIGAIKVPE